MPRTLPDFTCGEIDVRLSNMSCTWPPIRSEMPCGLPLYGTCTICVPVMILNSSPPRWPVVPLPPDAFKSLPGFCLRVIDQFLDGLHRQRIGHREHVVGGQKLPDEHEILVRIVWLLLFGQQRLVDRERHHVGVADGVAVRIRMHDHVGAYGLRRARAVVDHDLLAHLFDEFDGEDARHHVGRAAGRRRDDEPDRPLGIFGLCAACKGEPQREAQQRRFRFHGMIFSVVTGCPRAATARDARFSSRGRLRVYSTRSCRRFGRPCQNSIAAGVRR